MAHSLLRKPVLLHSRKTHTKSVHFSELQWGARHGGGSFELQMKFIKSNGALLLEPNKVIQTQAGRIRDCLLLEQLSYTSYTYLCVHMGNISLRQPLVFLEIFKKCYIRFTY